MIYDVIIIGSGVAGLTAAFRCGRAKRNTLLFSGDLLGGVLLKTDVIENFPSYPEGIKGFELMDKMIQQAEKYGTEFIHSMVEKVDFSSKIKKVWSEDVLYESKSVIICTGSTHNKLNIQGESEYDCKGVFYCYVCDGAFYKDKDVIVVGGGDSAFGGAEYLTKYCNKVTLIHRNDKFRASEILKERVFNNPKINVITNTTIREIKGDNKNVKSVITDSKNGFNHIFCDGVCPCIGSYPNTSLFKGILNMDENGYILKDTGIEGVFTAGDCSDSKYKQADVAAGEGSKASIDVEDYLNLIS